MKRVKVMLMAIAVIALAASTLAFKARYANAFCTTAATITFVDGQAISTCTTTDQLSTTLTCSNLVVGRLTSPNVFTATVCTASPTYRELDGEIIVTCPADLRCSISTTKLTLE